MGNVIWEIYYGKTSPTILTRQKAHTSPSYNVEYGKYDMGNIMQQM